MSRIIRPGDSEFRSPSMSRRQFLAYSGASAAALLYGCGSGGGGGENFAVLKQGVTVIPDDASVTISNVTDSGVTLSGNVPVLNPGNVIVSAQNGGVLRRVRAINQSGASLAVETEPATLADVFQEARIQFTREMEQSDFASITADAPGVSVAGRTRTGSRAGGTVYAFNDVGISKSIAEPVTIAITLNGTVAIALTLAFDIEFDSQGLKRVFFAPVVAGVVKVTAEAKVEAVLETPPLTYGTFVGQPLVIFVGDVPVIVTPTLVLSARASLAFEKGVALRSDFTAAAAGGFHYRRDIGTDPVMTMNASGSYVPEANFYSSFKGQIAFLQAKVELALYGVAGPYINAKVAALEGEFKAETNPRQVEVSSSYVYGVSSGFGASSILGAPAALLNVEFQSAEQNIPLGEPRIFFAGSGEVGVQ